MRTERYIVFATVTEMPAVVENPENTPIQSVHRYPSQRCSPGTSSSNAGHAGFAGGIGVKTGMS
jgi:hypothetical protein